MRTFLNALMFLAVAGTGALAQTPEQQIERSLQNARQRGIPAELLESKIAEGRAKGVPMDRIAVAIARRLEALEKAQAATTGRNLNPAELGVAADAIQAGVADAALRTLVATAPTERRAVAIATLTQLVQLGQASDVALGNVTEALKKGPDALLSLPAQAAAARARRGPPENVPSAANRQSGRGGGPPAGVPPGQAKKKNDG